MYIYTQKPTDWIFGSYTGIQTTEKNPGGQWLEYTPVMESQVIGDRDTWACTTFSTLSCLETLHKWKTGIEINWSDKYNAVLAGTVPFGGNTIQTVCDTIRSYGLVLESDCPFERWEAGYKIPQEIIDKGKKWFDNYALNFDSVRPTLENYQGDIINALEYSPLAVGVAYANGEGILNPKTTQNHLVALVGYKYGEYWLVMDSYQMKIKKYDWNYRFAGLVRFNLTIKNESMLKLEKNQCYKLIEGKTQLSGVAVAVDDNDDDLVLVVHPEGFEGRALMDSISRLGGAENLKVFSVSLADWNSVQKYDTKWEKIPNIDLKGNPI